MTVYLDESGTVLGLKDVIQSAVNDPDTRSLLILACDGNDFRPEQVDPLLCALKIPVVGGIFPAIIHEKTKLDRGTIVVALPAQAHCITIDGLSAGNVDFVAAIDRMLAEIPEFATLFVVLDAFAQRINELIGSLFTIFGLEHNYLGGGAGSLAMKSKPCVMTNEGLKSDAANIALLTCRSSVGVCHGWTSIAGPFRITESRGNVIKSIDWRPAFDVYREVLTRYGQVIVNRENFFSIAKGFPFGIARMDAERIVRDPVETTSEGFLVCVGEVPEGSFVDILNGDVASLLQAAHIAKRLRDENAPPGLKTPLNIIIDCISRVLFLGPRYAEEIEEAYTPGQPLVGACTMGEIANTGSEFIEFYNKTMVMGVLEGG